MPGLDAVNEKSTSIVVVSFFDENDDPVVPSAATYRIDDVESGQEIVDDTAIAGLAEIVNITVTDVQNALVDANNAFETRRVTINFTYGIAVKKGTAECFYTLKNLGGIPA